MQQWIRATAQIVFCYALIALDLLTCLGLFSLASPPLFGGLHMCVSHHIELYQLLNIQMSSCRSSLLKHFQLLKDDLQHPSCTRSTCARSCRSSLPLSLSRSLPLSLSLSLSDRRQILTPNETGIEGCTRRSPDT